MGVWVCSAGSSPHTRGAPITQFPSVNRSGIIPAYAGSTATVASVCCLAWDHPRIRGEHLIGALMIAVTAGSSPHTRGALLAFRGRPIHQGIIPAYAGSTLLRAPWTGRKRDHPRIRGEHTKQIPPLSHFYFSFCRISFSFI